MRIIKDRAGRGGEETVTSEILNNIKNSVCILQSTECFSIAETNLLMRFLEYNVCSL